MSKKITFFFILIFLTPWMAFGAIKTPAAESALPKFGGPAKNAEPSVNNTVKKLTVKENFDIIFVLDSSGSMKRTDPQDLRKAAAELLVSLLGPEDHIGLVSFGDSARTLVPLVPNLPDNRRTFHSAIQKITSQESYTNLLEAIKKGYEEIKASPGPNKILLLFSDGRMDLGSKEKDDSALKELMNFLPELVKAKIKLYTVAFSDESDRKLLNDLARETGGLFNLAKADKDIHVIFASVFEQVKLPDTVPLEGDSFYIDKEVQEATVLITKQLETKTKLIDPEQKELVYGRSPEKIDWYQTRVFDLITIKKPLPGRWRVLLSTKEGNKIFIITDLALKSSLKQNQAVQGEKTSIEAWLERKDKRITEKRVLESIFFMADVQEPNGNHVKFNLYPVGIKDNGDMKGIYANLFTFKQTGDYVGRILADGKIFKREQVRQIKVLGRPAQKGFSTPASSEARKIHQANSGEIWLTAFIKLGFINLFLFSLSAMALLARKWTGKGNGRKEKKEPGKSDDRS